MASRTEGPQAAERGEEEGGQQALPIPASRAGAAPALLPSPS